MLLNVVHMAHDIAQVRLHVIHQAESVTMKGRCYIHEKHLASVIQALLQRPLSLQRSSKHGGGGGNALVASREPDHHCSRRLRLAKHGMRIALHRKELQYHLVSDVQTGW